MRSRKKDLASRDKYSYTPYLLIIALVLKPLFGWPFACVGFIHDSVKGRHHRGRPLPLVDRTHYALSVRSRAGPHVLPVEGKIKRSWVEPIGTPGQSRRILS